MSLKSPSNISNLNHGINSRLDNIRINNPKRNLNVSFENEENKLNYHVENKDLQKLSNFESIDTNNVNNNNKSESSSGSVTNYSINSTNSSHLDIVEEMVGIHVTNDTLNEKNASTHPDDNRRLSEDSTISTSDEILQLEKLISGVKNQLEFNHSPKINQLKQVGKELESRIQIEKQIIVEQKKQNALIGKAIKAIEIEKKNVKNSSFKGSSSPINSSKILSMTGKSLLSPDSPSSFNSFNSFNSYISNKSELPTYQKSKNKSKSISPSNKSANNKSFNYNKEYLRTQTAQTIGKFNLVPNSKNSKNSKEIFIELPQSIEQEQYSHIESKKWRQEPNARIKEIYQSPVIPNSSFFPILGKNNLKIEISPKRNTSLHSTSMNSYVRSLSPSFKYL